MTDLQDWTDVLRLDELMTTHGREMLRRGGQPESGKPGCIEGALGSAWLAEKYAAEDTPRVVPGFVFACFALRGLAFNHCLTDGNKRLAWIAFVETLASIQLTVDVAPDEAAAFVERVIVEHLSGEDVVRWAAERITILDLPVT